MCVVGTVPEPEAVSEEQDEPAGWPRLAVARRERAQRTRLKARLPDGKI